MTARLPQGPRDREWTPRESFHRRLTGALHEACGGLVKILVNRLGVSRSYLYSQIHGDRRSWVEEGAVWLEVALENRPRSQALAPLRALCDYIGVELVDRVAAEKPLDQASPDLMGEVADVLRSSVEATRDHVVDDSEWRRYDREYSEARAALESHRKAMKKAHDEWSHQNAAVLRMREVGD